MRVDGGAGYVRNVDSVVDTADVAVHTVDAMTM